MKTKLLATGLSLMLFFSVSAQYISSTAEQVSAPYLNKNTVNNPIIRVRIDVGASGSVLNSLVFDHNGSTNPIADIQNAKVYYTGSSTIFSSSMQYASAWIIFPAASFNFTSSLSLTAGTNYLWLTYDIWVSAICNDYADAGCNSINVNSATQLPTVTSPPGAPVICGATGINEQSLQTGILISPNPATDKIYISFPATAAENITVKMYSVTGEIVFEEKIIYPDLIGKSTAPITKFQISVFNISNGIYFLCVQAGKEVITEKIVINR
jgi:hypothetical protein